MRNLTPVYVLMLLGAFAVGLSGTLLAARSLLPATMPQLSQPHLPSATPVPSPLQRPTRMPVPPATAPSTTEC